MLSMRVEAVVSDFLFAGIGSIRMRFAMKFPFSSLCIRTALGFAAELLRYRFLSSDDW